MQLERDLSIHQCLEEPIASSKLAGGIEKKLGCNIKTSTKT